MSRQKANQTRYLPNSKKIVWTVEWIDVDEKKTLVEVAESATISDVYAELLAERQRQSRKRKSAAISQDESQDAMPTESKRIFIESGIAEVETNIKTERPLVEELKPSREDQESDERPPPIPEVKLEQDEQASVRSLQQGPAAEDSSKDEADSKGPHFYLYRPHTASTAKVLIPLQDTTITLTQALTRRTVLEFPSLYTLPYIPTDLPKQFMADSDYETERQREEAELEYYLDVVDPDARHVTLPNGREEEDSDPTGAGSSGQWDERKILDMLRRDVHA